MEQKIKDQMIEAENENYKHLSREIYDLQQQLKAEYKRKQTEPEKRKMDAYHEHCIRMESIMAIQAERPVFENIK